MAGTQTTTYTTIVTESMRGYQNITLTNWTNVAEPLLAEGGRVEIKGSLFTFPGDEDIDPDGDFAGIGNSTQVYGYYVVAGANVTLKLTVTGPTWSEEFGAWMDAGETNRFWGGIYKDAGGDYADKFIYNGREIKQANAFQIDERGSLTLGGDISATDATITGTATIADASITDATIDNDITVTGQILSYARDTASEGTLLKSIAGAAGSVTFDIKKPISAYLKVAGGVAAGNYGTLAIIQNAADPTVTRVESDSNPNYEYAAMLNPGRYKLTNQHLLTTTYLYCTGVFGASTIVAGDIVT